MEMRFRRGSRRALAVLALGGVLVFISACSGSRSQVARVAGPAPTEVHTRLSLASATSAYYIDPEEGARLNSSSLDGYDAAAEESRGRRFALRALQKVSGALRKLEHRSMDDLLEEYQDRFNSLERRYDSVEEFVSGLGVEEREFRQGVGLTAATAVATLGTLHALKPIAATPGLLGTSVRAGYDVSRIDDPRLMVGYSDLLRVSVSKNGIGGTIHGDRVSYTGDINIRRLEASANMTIDQDLTLGTVYAHGDESVQGYVRYSF